MNWFRRNKARRKPNRKIDREAEQVPRNWRRPFAMLVVFTAVAAAGYGAWSAIVNAGYEEFRTLEISGPMRNVNAQDVQDVLGEHLKNGFLDFNIVAAREDVVSLPWVRNASLRRGWPGVLHVQLEEQEPVATWFGTALLNSEGEVFVDGAIGYSGMLPDLGGPAGMQSDLLERMRELRTELSTRSLMLKRVYRTERRAERIWLENGIEVRLGRRDYDKRLNRFVDIAWPALQDKAASVEYVDMRYTNGFAVGWKQEISNDAGNASGEASDVQENG